MNISIDSNRSETETKSTSSKNSEPSKVSVNTSTNKDASATPDKVSISLKAAALGALERQSSMSPKELRASFNNTQTDIAKFGNMIAGSSKADRSEFLPKTDNAERPSLAQKAIDFTSAVHQSPPGNVGNPYSGMDRNELSAIAYDDSGTFTEAERFAAFDEVQKQDYQTVTKFSAQATASGDNSVAYKGILEFFDSLPPIEKASYPEGHRDSIVSLLKDPNNTYAKKDDSGGTSNLANLLLDKNLSMTEKVKSIATNFK